MPSAWCALTKLGARWVFSCVAILLCLSFFLATPIQSQPSDKVVAVYGSTPTLDGAIDIGEWDDASIVIFSLTGGANCTVYVKQDEANLHVAFNISDNTYSADDACGIAFDVDHDGNVTLQADDILFIITRNVTIQEFDVTIEDWNPTTVSGWSAKAVSTQSVWQAEYNITYSKLNIIAGMDKTLGVFFFTFDSVITYNWPATTGWFRPDTWGDMTSNGYNWEVPELNVFSVFVILFLVFPAFYYWIKPRRLA